MQLNSDKRVVLLVAALAIALFLALPRLVIMVYVRNNLPAAPGSFAWGDWAGKLVYGFVVACMFLGLNMSQRKLVTVAGILDLSRFLHRLLVSLSLYGCVRILTLQFDLYGINTVWGKNAAVFMFNISLVLEICLCMLVAELYRVFVRHHQVRLKNETLQKINAEANFQALKNQVNPHFLFNSLNTIAAMIDSDKVAAKTFVTNMSEVYRYVLNSSGRAVVDLEEELGFVKAYVDMLQIRHGAALQVHFDVDKRYGHCLIPPISIQLLLENAVKHNIVSFQRPLQITVSAANDRLTVSHPLQERMVSEPSAGTGLYNLNGRYRYLFQRDIDICRAGGRFTVSMPLPDKVIDDPTGTMVDYKKWKPYYENADH